MKSGFFSGHKGQGRGAGTGRGRRGDECQGNGNGRGKGMGGGMGRGFGGGCGRFDEVGDFNGAGERRGRGGPFCNGSGFGGGRRGGRLFNHGDMRLLSLMLINEKPRHGYEIIKEIEERVGGAYAPSPGIIYPTLMMLEELGYVTASENENKKLHAITNEGKAHLAEQGEQLQQIISKMTQARNMAQSGPANEIIRAMENLKLSLHLRYAQSALTKEQSRTIAAEIDKIVARIEEMV